MVIYKLMKHIENVVFSMIREVLKERKEELTLFKVEEKTLLTARPPFTRITYTEAVENWLLME